MFYGNCDHGDCYSKSIKQIAGNCWSVKYFSREIRLLLVLGKTGCFISLNNLVMKKIRMGLMALAAVSGIGSAFAFNTPKKHFGTTYRAYIDAGGTQRWALNPPANYSCQSSSTVACTITSTSPQADVLATTNGFPANHTTQNSSDLKVYKPIP